MMVSCLILSILLLYSLNFPLVYSLLCSAKVYGSPNAADCEQALLEIPFARSPERSYQAQQRHIFVEPQFQKPPFGLINNRFRPEAIVQLPKVWRHNSCHVALMSQSFSDGSGVLRPLFTLKWQSIIHLSALLRSCFVFQPPRGGSTTVYLVAGDPAATLYMYDSDSAFSIVMNSYMSDAIPVLPPSHGLEVDALGNATRNPLTLDVISNLTRTLPLSEYKLLDSE